MVFVVNPTKPKHQLALAEATSTDGDALYSIEVGRRFIVSRCCKWSLCSSFGSGCWHSFTSHSSLIGTSYVFVIILPLGVVVLVDVSIVVSVGLN